MALTDRIVVIGGSGQLGSDLLRAFAAHAPIGVDHAAVDIEVPSSVAVMLARFRPTLVINTAAYHNVERCETLAHRAFAVNATAVDALATMCANASAALAHISTDYVFDGRAERPYREDAATGPLSVYGISKLAGEQLVRRRCTEHFIFRTSGLYGLRGSSTKGYTFIERMLEQATDAKPLRVVDDITFSPSYTLHTAHRIAEIVRMGAFGTYHVTNAGACTWYAFATEIFKQAGLSPHLEAVSSAIFPTYAPRPVYSALDDAASRALGLSPVAAWSEGIADYLAERSASSAAIAAMHGR